MRPNKKIIITRCGQCPNVGNKGGSGKIGYIPTCSIGGDLAYTEHILRGRIIARITVVIPDWCPLQDDIGAE